jgi:peroxiredoxin
MAGDVVLTADSLVSELECAFREVRDRNWSLAERLRYIRDEVLRLSPEFAAAVDAFVGRLERAGAGSAAPQVGDVMPPFMLPDENGRFVTLDELLADGPLVIAFIRGHWCPYCRLNAIALAEVQDHVAPARLVVVTAETQQYTRIIKAESGARFPFLTDMDSGYALSLGLAIWVDDTMSAMIKAAGWDIPEYQNGEAWILPIPSVFLVDANGIVRARHVDPDYRRRFEPLQLKAMVATLLAGSAGGGPATRHRAAE